MLAADGGADIGLGHISRSSALAVALEERGIGVRCFVLGAEPIERDGLHWEATRDLTSIDGAASADVLVIDSYTTGRAAIEAVPEGPLVVVMQEHVEPPGRAALVVSVGGAEDGGNGGNGRLHGPAYACLRQDFWGLPPRTVRDGLDRVLVTTGASLSGRDLAASIRAALPLATVALVAGPFARVEPAEGVEVLQAPSSLVEPLSMADLVVTAGGQTMLEAAATGVPTIALVLAENQRRQCQLLASLGAVRLVEPDQVVPAVLALAIDRPARHQLSRRAQRAIDGNGARRVAAEIARRIGAGQVSDSSPRPRS